MEVSVYLASIHRCCMIDLEDLAKKELQKFPELLHLMRSNSATLYGEFLPTLILNKVLSLNVCLPKPTIVTESNSLYSTLSEIRELDSYNLIYLVPSSREELMTTNFNSCYAYITDDLYVVVEQNFIDLISHRQLEITNLATPIKTLAELIQLKDKYSGYLYVDIDRQIAIINDYIKLVSRLNISKATSLIFVNKEYASIISNTVPGTQIVQLLSTMYSGVILYKVVLPEKGLLPLNVLDVLPGSFSSSVFFTIFNFLYGRGIKKSERELRLLLLDYGTLFSYALSKRNYLQHLPNGWKSKLCSLNKFVQEHNLDRVFNKCNTLAEQICIFDELKTIVAKHGIWIIGLLENQTSYDKASFIKLIEFKKLENSKWLVKPLSLPELPFGLGNTWKIIELHTRQLLINEGNYQHHCVGGYSVNEKHRIFSFQKQNSGFRYTVEVSASTDMFLSPQWRVVQARGKNNTVINSFAPEIVKDLNVLVPWLLSVLPTVISSRKEVFHEF